MNSERILREVFNQRTLVYTNVRLFNLFRVVKIFQNVLTMLCDYTAMTAQQQLFRINL